MPLSQGGRDSWENVVSACFHCNSRKGGRTPQQASMPLLAVPYRPSWVEHLILSNRNILADQMAFLKNHLPKRRRPVPLKSAAAIHGETVRTNHHRPGHPWRAFASRDAASQARPLPLADQMAFLKNHRAQARR